MHKVKGHVIARLLLKLDGEQLDHHVTKEHVGNCAVCLSLVLEVEHTKMSDV